MIRMTDIKQSVDPLAAMAHATSAEGPRQRKEPHGF